MGTDHRLTQALFDKAKQQGWTVVSVKSDWKRIFVWEQDEAVTSVEGKAIRAQ